MGKEYSDLDSLELQENSKMLIISILGIAILFVADLYVMINNPGNFVVFSIITILMLVWIFIFTRQMVKFQQQKRKKETEQLEELFRGQKANYLQPLQIILREILIMNDIDETMMGNADALARQRGLKDLLQYSVIVIASVPVMIIYPFVQKYFVKGVMIGAVKG